MRRVMIGLGLVTALALAAGSLPAAGEPGGNAFFNGTNLDGWEGLPGFWTVKDGALVGSTHPDGCKFNTFLCSKKQYTDFELSFQVRLVGKGWDGNSGVQIRSTVFDREHMAVKGPQCDIGQDYWGSLYGEHFGDKMMKAAPPDVVGKVLKKEEFNDYAIRCVGKHVTIRLGGATTVDDDFDNLPASGIIAWQLHQGPPLEVTFRNIRFKDLSKK